MSCLASWGVVVLLVHPSHAAESPEVSAAIARGRTYLHRRLPNLAPGFRELALYALIKTDPDELDSIARADVAKLAARVPTTGYAPISHHNYEAACLAMALEATDPVKYQPQLQLVARYLMATQLPHGGWYYTSQSDTGGDTSITQYALLGLWATQRAGIEIPGSVWERSAQWHLSKQNTNGGFSYHPGQANSPSLTMTVAGTGSLLLARNLLFNEPRRVEEPVQEGAVRRRKFGVLEPLAPVDDEPKKPNLNAKGVVTPSQIDRATERGIKAVASGFRTARSQTSNWHLYYIYGIERLGALAGIETIGEDRWYDTLSKELLSSQEDSGAWGSRESDDSSTSFAILFLTRATRSLVKRQVVEKIGGGIQIGGRGLPKNAHQFNMATGEATAKKGEASSLDKLLEALERPQETPVENTQQALVNTLALADRESLVGQLDLLKKLAQDPQAEVRRTACWALARSGDLTVAPLLIQRLSDTDVEVMREASLGLSVLSRKLEGLKTPQEPLAELEEGATSGERQFHLDQWSKAASAEWRAWYLKIRPYHERDDRQNLGGKSRTP